MSQTSVDYGRIERAVERMEVRLETQIRSEVGSVRSDLQNTRKDLMELSKKFAEYLEFYERRERVSSAENRKIQLVQELEQLYGHYRIVRRTSIGTLQAMDVDNVSDDTIRNVSEELMIQTPGYWLAPAIVAVAAWLAGDKDISERSVKEAFRRDKAKAALFFALVQRREERMEAAARWLEVYITSLDPRALGREFAVILECITTGAFGQDGLVILNVQLQRWNELLRDDDGVVDDQVRRWQTSIHSLADVPNAKSFETLEKLSPQWQALEAQLVSANGVYRFHEYLRDLDSKPVVKKTDNIEILDDILEQLVTEFDTEELPKRRELLHNEAIIEADGDLTRATERERVDEVGLRNTLDLLQLQSISIIAPETIGASVGTQKVAFGGIKDVVHRSVGEYTKEYRGKAVINAELLFDKNHSNYADFYGFPASSTPVLCSTGEPQATALQRLAAAWDGTFAAYIASVTFSFESMRLMIIACVGVVVLAMVIDVIFGLIGFAVAAAVLAIQAFSKQKTAARLVAAAERKKQEAAEYTFQMYRDACVQFVDATMTYEELDDEEEPLLQMVDTWSAGKELFKEGEASV